MQVNKFQLLEEIRNLSEKESQLAGRKAAIHQDQILYLFSLGQKIQQLYEACQKHGEYKVLLAQVGMYWVTANRTRKTWLYFGQYRKEPWIFNFGKSAFHELVHVSEPDMEIIEHAIALAKSGVKVGVAWVRNATDKKRSGVALDEKVVHAASIRKVRLSAKVRKLVHVLVDEIGEEEVLRVLEQVRRQREAG